MLEQKYPVKKEKPFVYQTNINLEYLLQLIVGGIDLIGGYIYKRLVQYIFKQI